MIEPERFVQIVKQSFSFLITEHEMKIENENLNGNYFYDVTYSDSDNIISISLENIENYFQVIIFKLDRGKLPNYDDKTRTIHLNELNKRILTKVDKSNFIKNSEHFNGIEIHGDTENLILKSAKELRLCLKYLVP